MPRLDPRPIVLTTTIPIFIIATVTIISDPGLHLDHQATAIAHPEHQQDRRIPSTTTTTKEIHQKAVSFLIRLKFNL